MVKKASGAGYYAKARAKWREQQIGDVLTSVLLANQVGATEENERKNVSAFLTHSKVLPKEGVLLIEKKNGLCYYQRRYIPGVDPKPPDEERTLAAKARIAIDEVESAVQGMDSVRLFEIGEAMLSLIAQRDVRINNLRMKLTSTANDVRELVQENKQLKELIQGKDKKIIEQATLLQKAGKTVDLRKLQDLFENAPGGGAG